MITMNVRDNIQKLLDQKVVFDLLKRMLVSFRKSTMALMERRSFEVKIVQAG